MGVEMKELVVVSGKGGTGKTSIAASFAVLHEKAVCADCDVDASNLHLLLQPSVHSHHEFRGGQKARIRTKDCTDCGLCMEMCRFNALSYGDTGSFIIDEISCEGCGVCVHFCPEKAIDLYDTISGEWFVSETRAGPMVHARLDIAQENSGKLVTIIRKQARKIAEEMGYPFILVDGSPGIGCPVIASVTNANMVLLVTEPTLSGMHDLERIADLASQLDASAAVCVNKWDLNHELTQKIESMARERNMILAGRVRYDGNINEAQVNGQTIVEFTGEGAAVDIKKLWVRLSGVLN